VHILSKYWFIVLANLPNIFYLLNELCSYIKVFSQTKVNGKSAIDTRVFPYFFFGSKISLLKSKRHEQKISDKKN